MTKELKKFIEKSERPFLAYASNAVPREISLCFSGSGFCFDDMEHDTESLATIIDHRIREEGACWVVVDNVDKIMKNNSMKKTERLLNTLSAKAAFHDCSIVVAGSYDSGRRMKHLFDAWFD